MNEVSLSAAARSAITSLTSIQGQMNVLQARLASGKRVATPFDNPTTFFLAQNLTSRAAQISGLAADLESAQSTIGAANNGIAAIQSLLSSAQSLANQALQNPETLTTVTGTKSSMETDDTIASIGGSATRFRQGDTVTVSDGTTTATYTAANNDDVQDFLDAINNTANLKVDASLNSSGQIELAATSNVNVTIGGSINGAGGGTLTSIIGLTAGTTSYVNNTVRSNLALQFNSLRSQIDAAAQDASYNGVNLLTGGSLTAKFNETGSSTMTMSGSSMTTTGLGVSASTNTWQLDSDINAAMSEITAAISSLQSSSATFSSMGAVMEARTDFNKAMVDTLNSGADAMTANDSNEDSAMLLALQTRQQIAVTALSLAQGSDSTALKLFGY